ncbi:MAG: MASE3 domain-containing protein, partial [Burkholderiales bacterium]|nr:MASE3 domain-containing protein [Burkholderiales bacterium]
MHLFSYGKDSDIAGSSRKETFSACPHQLVCLIGVLALVLLAARIFPQYRVIDHADTYLWLHTAMETLSVTICGMIFGLYWAMDNRQIARGVTILSCGLLGVALLDFGHLLSYPGMPTFVTPSSADKAIAFWLAARALAALALLSAALSMATPFATASSRYVLIALTLLIAGIAFWLILGHPDQLPPWFIPGQGLTRSKILVEYLLTAVYMAAAFGFYHQYRRHPGEGNALLLAASIVAALSELWFTAYFSVSDQSNLLGHIYKIIAYLLIYEALFTKGVQEPFAQLDQSRRALAESEHRFRRLTALSSDWYWEQDAQHRFTKVSRGISALTGFTPEQLIGKTRWQVSPSDLSDEQWQAHRATLEAHQPFQDLVLQRVNARNEKLWIRISGEPMFDDRGNFLGYRGISKDITDRECNRENLELAASVIEHC